MAPAVLTAEVVDAPPPLPAEVAPLLPDDEDGAGVVAPLPEPEPTDTVLITVPLMDVAGTVAVPTALPSE